MAEESVAHKTARTSVWGAIEKISTMGIQFVVSMVLARLLSPSDYGTIAMLTVFIAISDQFVTCGFANALIRKPDCQDVDYSTAFWFNIVAGVGFYGILFCIAPFVADFYGMDILCPILRVCGLALPIGALRLVQYAILVKHLKAEKTAIIHFVCSIVSGVIGIYMAYTGYGVWSLVAQQLTSGLLTALILWTTSDWYPRWEFSHESMKYLWGFGSKMLVTGIISSIYGNIYSILIGKFYDRAALGVFNRGQKLAKLFPDVAESVFVKNSLPILSQLQDDKERLTHVYRELVKVACFITIPAVCMISVLAEPFVRVVLTEKWMASVVYIQLFAATSFLSPANSINLNLLQTFGRSDYTLKAEILKKSICLIVVFTLLPFGPLTLALGSCCMDVLAFSINLYFAKKLSGLHYTMQIKDVLPILVSSILMSAIMLLTVTWIGSNLLKMIIGVIIGLSVYVALTKWVFRLNVYKQIDHFRK